VQVDVVVVQLNHGLTQSVHILFIGVLLVPQLFVQTPPEFKYGVDVDVFQVIQKELLLQVKHGETHV
jgi:hypothetical protein